MATCPTRDPRDLAANTRAAALLWGLPAIGFLVGFFVEPLPRTVLWTASLSVGGGACLVNAFRSRRLREGISSRALGFPIHLSVTGPERYPQSSCGRFLTVRGPSLFRSLCRTLSSSVSSR